MALMLVMCSMYEVTRAPAKGMASGRPLWIRIWRRNRGQVSTWFSEALGLLVLVPHKVEVHDLAWLCRWMR